MQNLPPMKYSHKTRIGNWSEEQELEETKLKDFVKLKDTGSLKTNKLQAKLDQSLIKASITYSKDGYLHFGDHIMLYNQKTLSYMVTDIYDKLTGVDEAYTVTTSKNTFPCARSVFILKRYERDMFSDEIIHYGQKIQIQINPLLIKKDLYLHSCPVSPGRASKVSRKQEVGFFAKNNFETVWIIEHIDPKIRFENSGFPVQAGAPILLKHCHTAQWLAADMNIYKNDFGSEYEVYCQCHQSLNKTQNLISEKAGRTTIDIPSRNQSDQNTWYIQTATDQSQEFDESVILKPLTAADYILLLRKKLIQKGEHGIRGLRVSFSKCDPERRGKLELDDFKWGLRNYGIILNLNELECLFSEYDKEMTGLINYERLIDSLRCSISQKRRKLVEKLYSSLQAKFGKNLTFEHIVKAFNFSKHQDVVKNRKTEKELFKEFTNCWIGKMPDHSVSFEEFLEYFNDVSGSIENDDQFEYLTTTLWDIQFSQKLLQ